MGLISKIVPETGGEIWIWHISEDEEFFIRELHVNTISHLPKFASLQRRLQFLAIRYLLKLAGHGEEINYMENGKPFLHHGSISISHTPAFAGIYLADKNVGLDIELISPRVRKIARKFLSEDELNTFGLDDLSLTLLWGTKEAVYKKYGGDTTHFSKNILVRKIEEETMQVTVDVTNNGIDQSEALTYQIHSDIVIVYTT